MGAAIGMSNWRNEAQRNGVGRRGPVVSRLSGRVPPIGATNIVDVADRCLPGSRRSRASLLLLVLATLTAFALSTVRSVEASEPVSFFDDFAGPDGIITNLFGSANPDIEGAHVSDKWQATSGTLYRQNNEGWSGVPDRIPPGFNSTIDSIPYNDSAIFRVVNKGPLFDEVTVNVRLKPIRFLTAQETDRLTPGTASISCCAGKTRRNSTPSPSIAATKSR